MPDAVSQLGSVGGITKALLNALDQIENQVAASLVGPDGKPSGTAIYMHMPIGYPVDPKMFANAWSPAGGDSGASFSDDGRLTRPQSRPPLRVLPPGRLARSIRRRPSPTRNWKSRFRPRSLLEACRPDADGDFGTASPSPGRTGTSSVEYFTVIEGMQPIDQTPPAQAVLDAVAAAQNLLYIKDANGNFIGYTPLYASFRRNQTALAEARAAQAMAYAQAMSDPIAGQEWPIVAQTYANKVTQALNDFDGMGARQVQDALDTIATQGEGAVTALAAMARQMWAAYQVQLAGGISANVPWSYIEPDFVVGLHERLDWRPEDYRDEPGARREDEFGAGSFADNWQRQQSQSTSGSGGVNVGFASASASGSHADASNAFGNHANQYNFTSHQDHSSSASVTLEFFLATIERAWFLGDIFNIKGWYMVGQRAHAISDGTIDNQIGDKSPAILPMLPKGFLVIRNVTIKCDDWGDFGDAFNQAMQASQGSGQSSSNSVAVSASYLFYSASGQHQDQQSSGAFGSQQTSSGFTFTSDGGRGGTLQLLGSQIAGWIGQIQAAAPLIDDPTLPKPTSATNTPQAMAGGGAAAAAQPGS